MSGDDRETTLLATATSGVVVVLMLVGVGLLAGREAGLFRRAAAA